MAEPHERASRLPSPVRVLRRIFGGLLRDSWTFATSETGMYTALAQLR